MSRLPSQSTADALHLDTVNPLARDDVHALNDALHAQQQPLESSPADHVALAPLALERKASQGFGPNQDGGAHTAAGVVKGKPMARASLGKTLGALGGIHERCHECDVNPACLVCHSCGDRLYCMPCDRKFRTCLHPPVCATPCLCVCSCVVSFLPCVWYCTMRSSVVEAFVA